MRYEGKTALLSRRELTIGFLTGAISSFFGIGRIGSPRVNAVTTESLRQSESIGLASINKIEGNVFVGHQSVLMHSEDGVNWTSLGEIADMSLTGDIYDA